MHYEFASAGEGVAVGAVAQDVEELLAVCDESEVSGDGVHVLVHVAESHLSDKGLLRVVLVRLINPPLLNLRKVHASAEVEIIEELRVEADLVLLLKLAVEVREAKGSGLTVLAKLAGIPRTA